MDIVGGLLPNSFFNLVFSAEEKIEMFYIFKTKTNWLIRASVALYLNFGLLKETYKIYLTRPRISSVQAFFSYAESTKIGPLACSTLSGSWRVLN